MGIQYDPQDSINLINDLQKNITSCRKILDNSKDASHKLVALLRGDTFGGEAYTACEKMFTFLVLPTIAKGTELVNEIEQQLGKYRVAADAVGNEYLHDETLQFRLVELITQKEDLVSQIHAVESLQFAADTLFNSDVVQMYDNMRKKSEYLLELKEDEIRGVREDLQKLETFCKTVGPLFIGSLAELEKIMSVVGQFNTVNLSDGFSLNDTLAQAGLFYDLTDGQKNTIIAERKIIELFGRGNKITKKSDGSLWIGAELLRDANGNWSSKGAALSEVLSNLGDYDLSKSGSFGTTVGSVFNASLKGSVDFSALEPKNILTGGFSGVIAAGIKIVELIGLALTLKDNVTTYKEEGYNDIESSMAGRRKTTIGYGVSTVGAVIGATIGGAIGFIVTAGNPVGAGVGMVIGGILGGALASSFEDHVSDWADENRDVRDGERICYI